MYGLQLVSKNQSMPYLQILFIKILISVLMGRGLVDWILVDNEKRREFHAVPHAVESLKTMDIPRSIFAVMKSPPLEAFPGIP